MENNLNKNSVDITERKHKLYYKLFHWFFAVIIFYTFYLAFSFDDMPFSPEKIQLINEHKWFGFVVLILFLPRLIVKKGYNNFIIKNKLDKLVHYSHYLFYFLFFMTPFSGYLMSCAFGYQINMFNILSIPMLISKNIELAEILESAHVFFAWSLLCMIIVHVGGAIHRQIKKEKVITNMIK